MKSFKFLDWKVYNDSKILFAEVLKLIGRIPKEFRFDLSSQVLRSALSVSLNIAEGSGKSSDKELNRFLEIALGSLYETLPGVDILRGNEIINESDFNNTKRLCDEIAKQIGGFKKRL